MLTVTLIFPCGCFNHSMLQLCHTVPAGIYAKVKYGTSLSNVDWLHGGAESLLTLTNLFIVLGLRAALRKTSDSIDTKSIGASEFKEKNPLP
nr:1-acyl-sn-glycerol-3-phosphate acyltransferase delta isoform 1 [Ipomoea batatas]